MADIPVSQLTLLHAQPIEQAQRDIASDWIATYQRYLGEPTPAPARPRRKKAPG